VINIAEEMQKMREAIPEPLRVAGMMIPLAAATDAYALSAQQEIIRRYSDTVWEEVTNLWDYGPGGMAFLVSQIKFIRPQVDELLLDLDMLRMRIKEIYLPSLSGLDVKAPIPVAVRPLFYKVPGRSYFTPEAFGPASALNQFDELDEVNRSLINYYQEAVLESAGQVAIAIAKGAKEGVEAVFPNIWIALFGVAAVGAAVYAYRKAG